jgi:hypothetical protein
MDTKPGIIQTTAKGCFEPCFVARVPCVVAFHSCPWNLGELPSAWFGFSPNQVRGRFSLCPSLALVGTSAIGM